MDITESSKPTLSLFFHQIFLRGPSQKLFFTTLLAGTSCTLVAFLFPVVKRKFEVIWIARHNRLPIGLPNSNNLCYLNALLQAMAANRSLVQSLKRSAAVRRDRLLCCLVALLEGLRCSANYLKKHKLVEVVAEAHRTLVEELALTDKWAVSEQQDAHELFGFFMELANGHEIGRTAVRANEGLLSVSRLLGRSHDMSVARCYHRNSPLFGGIGSCGGVVGGGEGTYPDALRQANFHTLRMTTFQHHLLASQVICSKCTYKSNMKLTPETSITLFPSDYVKKPKQGHGRRKPKNAPKDINLEGLLDAQFRTAENLTGVHCPTCHMKSLLPPADLLSETTPLIDKKMATNLAQLESRNTCYCRRWVAHLPPCLVIYVQRAVWLTDNQLLPNTDLYVYSEANATGSSLGVTSKFSEHVRFPLHLDMAPYLCSGRVSSLALKQQHLEFEKIDANSSAETVSPPSDFRHNENLTVNGVKRIPRRYVLRSVVVHQGNSLQAGHYVAYRGWRQRRTACDDSSSKPDWLFTSDRYVAPVPLKNVLNTQAFMLFYECEPSLPQLEDGSLSSTASRSHSEPLNEQMLDGASDSEDDEFGDDYEDEEEALDVFDGLSKVMRIKTLARAALSDVS